MKNSILLLCFMFSNVGIHIFGQGLGTVRPNTNNALASSYNFQEYVFAEPNDQGECLGKTNSTAKIDEVFISQTHRNTVEHPFFFMIGYRPALIQLAVTGNGDAPDVTIEGVLNGNSMGVLCLKGPTQLANNIDLNTPNFTDYFSVTLPKSWVQDGLELTLKAGSQKRILSSAQLKIGPYTELNLVRVTMDMLDYNTEPHKFPPADDFLQEMASAIPASMVRFGTFPKKLNFPELVASNNTEQLVRLKSKVGVGNSSDPSTPSGGNVNATMNLFIGAMHRGTGDYLSTFYVGNTLNFNDGGWGGGRSLVCADFGGVFIHELGHALSLPHWGQGSYGAIMPNEGDYIYPYGGVGNDGGGRGKNWSFNQYLNEFVSPKCQNKTADAEVGEERSDCMQRQNVCDEQRSTGRGPWDGFGDFSAIAMHRFLVGAAVKSGTVFDRNSQKVYQLDRRLGFPKVSLKNGGRVYTRDALQPEEKTSEEVFGGGPGSEKVEQDVYLIYGSLHPSQNQANIVYKPIKFKGALPPVLDPTDPETFKQISGEKYRRHLYWSHDITFKLTYQDGSVLHMINPYQSYNRDSKTDFTNFRRDVSHFSLVVPGDKELLKVEVYDRSFVNRGEDDNTIGNVNYKPYNITASNFMNEAVFKSKYEFEPRLGLGDSNSSIAELANMYPNPVKNSLTLEIDDFSKYLISITSISGQVVYQSELKSRINELALENISNGMYIVTLKNKEAEVKWIKKLIKE